MTSRGRVALLFIAALLLTAFLIWTNLWIVALLLFLVAPVRETILREGKAQIMRFLNEAN